MTSADRVQLEKDILYEHHKASGDVSAQIVKLRRMQIQVQLTADKLRNFLDYAEGDEPIRRDGAPSATLPSIDTAELESECRELVKLREKLDQLEKDKKGLGL